MSGIVIKTEHLTKDYGNHRGIFGIDLEVKQGEVFGFIGTNGSGKTTTIRSLMGFIRPDGGKSMIAGMNSWKYPAQIMNCVSYIPGEIAFPPLATGTDFLKCQAEYLNVKNFDYLNTELTVSGMLENTLEIMGVDPDMIEKMSETDTSAMLNRMYYTVTGLLPVFLLIVILANSLIAEKVDKGSMAYVLSTPTRRSAVAITQLLFLIVVPLILIAVLAGSRIFTSYLFYDEVNVPAQLALFSGMYLLVEAVCGICYLGSCLFNRSKSSMGFGGGFTAWFFLASLIGMFGNENLVNTGMGVKELDVFNRLTLIGLYDIDALSTVGTGNVDYAFVWKLLILAVISIACYVTGALRFCKKDLPL